MLVGRFREFVIGGVEIGAIFIVYEIIYKVSNVAGFGGADDGYEGFQASLVISEFFNFVHVDGVVCG